MSQDVYRYANEEHPSEIPLNGMGQIPVIVRLVLQDGSEEWWPGKAVRWTSEHVLVGRETDPGNPRSMSYIWLKAADVARVLKPKVYGGAEFQRGTTA